MATPTEPKTSEADVKMTFHRYHGRAPYLTPPNDSERALVDFLMTKSPEVVEQRLSENSPITKGKLWHDFKKEEPAAKDLRDRIADMGFNEADTAILQGFADMADTNNYSAQPTAEEVNKEFQRHLVEAEADLTPYFNKVQSQDLADLRTRMGDLRMSTEMYKQQESLNYKDTLAKTKQSLGARGMTFSGEGRKQLGQQGALNSKGVEGNIPMQRRYDWEEYSAKVQRTARDAGTAAERQYGSRAVGEVQGDFGNFANPYGGGRDYNADRYSPLYNVSRIEGGKPQDNYVRSAGQTEYATGPNQRYVAQADLDRQAAIRKRAQDAMNYGTYK